MTLFPLAQIRQARGIELAAGGLALVLSVPALFVLAHLLVPAGAVWAHLGATVLPRYLAGTVALLGGVLALAAVIGVGTAWIVTMHRFPGRAWIEVALILPLAAPAYVVAYAYTDLLQAAGPVQGLLREITGLSARELSLPSIRSLGGAVIVMALTLYPYVYLSARSAFLEQSVSALEAGRLLGRGPLSVFWTLALPLARPSVVAGLSLVAMEVLADFGTVQYFAVDTFTTGIYRTWFALGSPRAAAQLAACLLVAVLVVLMLERLARGGARHSRAPVERRPPPAAAGPAGLLLTGLCLAPVLLGFVVPVLALLRLHLGGGDPLLGARFLTLAGSSIALALSAALLILGLALLLAAALRLTPRPGRLAWSVRLASLGYAVPGSVIAVGTLLPLAAVDHALDGLARQLFAVSTGLVLTGSIAALLYAYAVRFLAVALGVVEAALGRIRVSLDGAARLLGSGPAGLIAAVHLPLLRGSLAVAALMVFVDVIKELPATIILRPFNFDTLAVRVYQLAADERLAEAATGALALIALGLPAVVVLALGLQRQERTSDAPAG